MKYKLHTLLVALLLLTAADIRAQGHTAAELIEKNIEARGGSDALEALQNIRQQGTATMQGMEAPLVIYSARPDKMRTEIEIQGMRIINAFDGEVAWMDNPMSGGGPARAPQSQVEATRRQTRFDGLLVDYEENDLTIEYAGEDEVRGEPAYKLDVTDPAGQQTTVYLDQESLLEVKMEREVDSPQMGMVTVATHLDDYREVGDVMFPFSLRTVMGGQTVQELQVESIVVNTDVPDTLFSFPEE